jgi:hypothetical protein
LRRDLHDGLGRGDRPVAAVGHHHGHQDQHSMIGDNRPRFEPVRGRLSRPTRHRSRRAVRGRTGGGWPVRVQAVQLARSLGVQRGAPTGVHGVEASVRPGCPCRSTPFLSTVPEADAAQLGRSGRAGRPSYGYTCGAPPHLNSRRCSLFGLRGESAAVRLGRGAASSAAAGAVPRANRHRSRPDLDLLRRIDPTEPHTPSPCATNLMERRKNDIGLAPRKRQRASGVECLP